MQAIKDYSALDVRIQLQHAGETFLKRVPAPVTYEKLSAVVTQLLAKNGLPTEGFRVRYLDVDALWVVVEDDSDLEIAYTLALSSDKKVTFVIQPKEPRGEDVEMAEEEEPVGKRAGKKQRGGNGIPRKALRNMIQSQLENQAQQVFSEFLKDKNFDKPEGQAEESKDPIVEHTGVACDGCGEAPIRGDRFKCSVCTNFDYCSTCEERLGHEHPFLKIRVPGNAPDVMVTFLNENQPAPEENWRNRGGARGRGGRGGCRGGGFMRGGAIKNMLKQFLGEADVDLDFLESKERKDPNEFFGCILKAMQKFQESGKLEEVMKKHQDGQFNFDCGKKWKVVRARVVSKPEQVLEAYAGQMLLPEIEIENGTFWPWKQGCMLTFDDDISVMNIPIELIKVPIDFEVKGKQTFKLNVPVTVLESAVASD